MAASRRAVQPLLNVGWPLQRHLGVWCGMQFSSCDRSEVTNPNAVAYPGFNIITTDPASVKVFTALRTNKHHNIYCCLGIGISTDMHCCTKLA